ncbi:MAG: bifunctional precorrin-2 dehydrogenase/sirohydrochlorin ferrochelatase [Methanoregulaceae archaeon]|nr:MAG: bifunctional precorrin-2 dehydrogenase/sirohydrochlorin ferrochelatase [Methanoregulaceae archaeon]RPI37256.1 MAG: bifunctional precorrin-2 dehydrogenase/sirohydrochlorin ferrochelatase [Methanoregulaceae archaeon]
MIPLFIDCSGRRIVIFGGGAVAARKAAYFSKEARVLVISRSFVQKIDGLSVERKKMDVNGESDASISDLTEDAFLVIGALSDPAQNNRIGRLCHTKGILFNNADGDAGDVILPAVSSGEHFTLAISTGGSSPAISRFIREHLEQDLLPGLDTMIVLQHRLREELKHREPDQAKRNTLLRRVLDDPSVWNVIRTDPDRAWDTVLARYLYG